MRKPAVSIVIPTWNEEGNITLLLKRIQAGMKKHKIEYEIIVVDDHSTDSTVRILKKLASTYPLRVFTKRGKKGKAQSVLEGMEQAQFNIFCMIDADLQYPPEAIPLMVEKIYEGTDIVVANRKQQNISKLRTILSRGFRTVFGKVLFGLPYDVQAGLKVFTREVWETVKFAPTSGWTFDLTFLYKAREAGYVIASQDILFERRKNGTSKIGFLTATLEIGINALTLRMKKIQPLPIPPSSEVKMQGAGIGFKRKKYITHTTLHHSDSALQTFIAKQQIFITTLLLIAIIGMIVKPIFALQVIVAILSFIYFIDVIFNLYLILKSLQHPQEIQSTEEEIKSLQAGKLPVYSILCPLYKEAHVIPQFLDAIAKLDYPKNKLDVLLLLEEDDRETIDAVKTMKLPSFVRVIVVPHSMPKTKPKACNYGLAHAKGEYLVIYDAEDMPDPQQLKKAFLAFQKVDRNVLCLQAKLNYYNPHQNLLTRFFTAEYSLWFDITLTGLQSVNTSIPLGGTSNHFRTQDLIALQGWDPFNVTEDADLGIRLFKKGYKTAIIDSVTLEEANSKYGNWFRQRSRWIKGYMQTYLVHTRKLFRFTKEQGVHSLLFHLTIGGKIAFILINPFLWLATIAYFALYSIVGSTIERLYPSLVFYMAASSLVFGNFLFLYYYMIGLAKRNQWNLVKFTFLVPIYWLMISIAGFMALYQLLFKPHYWEKTVHGLHLSKTKQKVIIFEILKINLFPFDLPSRAFRRLQSFISKEKFTSGGIFIIANAIASVFTFIFSAYLGRRLNFENFALVSLINGFLSISSMIYGSLGTTMNYKMSYLMGQSGEASAVTFWAHIRRYSLYASYAICIVWLLLTPFLTHYFNLSDIFPILLFTPILLVNLAASADKGILFSKLNFKVLSFLTILEPFLRVLFAMVFVMIGQPQWVYASIPLAAVIAFLAGWMNVFRYKKILTKATRPASFPVKFLFMSLLSGFSVIIFMNFDVLFAKHYLSSNSAGIYALTATIVKMFFFLSSLAAPFTIPLVSRNEGAKVDSRRFLSLTILGVLLITIPAFIVVVFFGNILIPLFFGAHAVAVLPYFPLFGFAILCFSVARVYTDYYLAKRYYTFPIMSFAIGALTMLLLSLFHATIWTFVIVMSGGWIEYLAVTMLLHLMADEVKVLERNIADFFGLFLHLKTTEDKSKTGINILIFNWRDTKHKWAGGAELYIHELAQRWVKDGNKVTVFCGNDGLHSRNETIDGVEIIRRGGFYTVYLWAALYYIFRFRNHFDVIIDSENGIPFFTPLYAKIPIYLLIHHVHQEIHRTQLRFPLSVVAMFLEGQAMPFVYKNVTVITVSESSKKETMKIGFTEKNKILIIPPGIHENTFAPGKKTMYPSLLYLGRLKPYKNIDTAMKAFAQIHDKFPTAIFTIAGSGEFRSKLEKLAEKLGIAKSVRFLGIVTEQQKRDLYASSWLCVQPSLIEGWGITVIEANASGTAVVASRVNGLQDSVLEGKTGFLVQPKSVDEFAQVFALYFSKSDMRKTFEKQALQWSKNFSWEASATLFYHAIISEEIHRYRNEIYPLQGTPVYEKA